LPQLVLASTSPFRRQLLDRLGLPFEARPPGTDEAEIDAEAPSARALRLATEKAAACVAPAAVVIGSDQVAALESRILHKPGTPERTLAQLSACQGKAVDFFTAVAVCAEDRTLTHVDHTRVVFRRLPQASLEYYITQEQPFGCAGGFKAEGLGIALFERIESEDPTALIGLPLIWLAAALRQCGLDPLSQDGPARAS
jgi:septum formation protein